MLINYRTFLVIILSASTLVGCDAPETSSEKITQEKASPFDIDEMKKVIQEKTKRFTEAHITGDIDFLNNCFTQDANIYPPNSDAVTGHSDIVQLNHDWVNYGVYEFTETSTAFYGNEDLLVDEGTYYLRYGPDSTVDKGKYINIWKPENGDWKICSNIWNTSLPAEGAE